MRKAAGTGHGPSEQQSGACPWTAADTGGAGHQQSSKGPNSKDLAPNAVSSKNTL